MRCTVSALPACVGSGSPNRFVPASVFWIISIANPIPWGVLTGIGIFSWCYCCCCCWVVVVVVVVLTVVVVVARCRTPQQLPGRFFPWWKNLLRLTRAQQAMSDAKRKRAGLQKLHNLSSPPFLHSVELAR